MTMQTKDMLGLGAAVMAALALPTAVLAQSAAAKASVDSG
jgi:hypothetical protein